jgi:hypothetical protein
MFEMIEREKHTSERRKLFFAEVGFFFVAITVVGLVIFLLVINWVE